MQTLIHADIFFFVTTIAVIVIGIAVVIALVYIIIILRNISHISDKIKAESDEVLQDIRQLRGTIKNQGFKVGMLMGFIKSIFSKKNNSREE